MAPATLRVVGTTPWHVATTPDADASKLIIAFATTTSCAAPYRPVPLDRVETNETADTISIAAYFDQNTSSDKASDAPICMGNATEATTEVTLDAPVGGRTVLDAGAVPATSPS